MLACSTRVLSLTKQLVEAQSIVNTQGETELARQVFQLISGLSYFRQYPEQVRLQQTFQDVRERYNVLAYVLGTKQICTKTIILMGHLDTVGIDDYGRIKNLACNPDTLKQALERENHLPVGIKQHLDSGKWLFGRGVLDMKAGLAANLYLLSYYAGHPEELAGNLVFLAACDEEDSSHGVLSALELLKTWRDEQHWQYLAAINADFVAPRYEGDNKRYVYQGSVGKLLPAFYIAGSETHVGSCFEGFDPNFLAAELTRQIEYNPDLCNQAYGETTAPPVCLKQADMKPSYSVQTAQSALVYYNFMLHSWSPKETLDILKRQAETAFEQALGVFEQRYYEYCRISGEPYYKISWQVRVLTFAELTEMMIKEHGEKYLMHMLSYQQQLLQDTSLDTRMFATKVVEEAWKWVPDKTPAIILFYSSLYSPRVEVTGKNPQESKLIQALQQGISYVQAYYQQPIVARNFFPYISDMSFLALSDDDTAIQAACDNTPGWGSKLTVDYQAVKEINVPVINIGPYGYDAHKKFERMEIEYSTQIVPNLINQVVLNLLSDIGQKDTR